jgi:hypothetical protein
MAAAKDFKQSADGDILFQSGDFFVDFSDQQHILDIVYSAPKWYTEFPACGVNIQYYLSGAGLGAQLNRNLQLQLQADGYTNTNSSFTQDYEGNLNLNTDATRI